MPLRFPKYVRLVSIVLFTVLAAAGCDDDDDNGMLTAPTEVSSSFVSVEPEAATPEFVAESSCTTGSPFGVRIVIVIGGNRDVLVRRLRFSLFDVFGRSAAPLIVAPLISSAASAGSAPGSVTLPGSSPVPIPGSGMADGLLITAGNRRSFPFLLQFGCDVPPAGTLVATVETLDQDGKNGTSEVRVRVGR